MGGIAAVKHPDRHPPCDVNQRQPPHRHRNGQLNPKRVGKTQADGVRTGLGQPDQHHEERRTEHQCCPAKRRGVGRPGADDSGHAKEQEHHNRTVVNIADNEVVRVTDGLTFGPAALRFSKRQQLRVHPLQRHFRLAIGGRRRGHPCLHVRSLLVERSLSSLSVGQRLQS